MNQILNDFSSAFRQHSINPPDRMIADGQIHRFRSGPEREQNGYYRLTILPSYKGGEIGFGTIGCWKRGFQEKWCSHQPGEIDHSDRVAIERARTEQKWIETQEALAAIGRGKQIWANCREPDAQHPYLVAKSILPLGIKQHDEALVVPIFRDGGLISLQFIAPDGSKRFLKGGHVEGGYASIGAKGSDKSRIILAEGYATGASLHGATRLPVVVAFNAGNLLPVARAIRAKYPGAEIVIGADNDQWTVVRGKPLNVGVEKARQAADPIAARVSWPDFALDDSEKPTDWNDYARRFGGEMTAAAFADRTQEPMQEAPFMKDVPIQ